MTSRRVWTRFDRLGLVLMLWLVMILTACGSSVDEQNTSAIENVTTLENITTVNDETTGKEQVTSIENQTTSTEKDFYDLLSVPEYSDSAFVIINDNKPYFTEDLLTNTTPFDSLTAISNSSIFKFSQIISSPT